MAEPPVIVPPWPLPAKVTNDAYAHLTMWAEQAPTRAEEAARWRGAAQLALGLVKDVSAGYRRCIAAEPGSLSEAAAVFDVTYETIRKARNEFGWPAEDQVES